MKNGREPAHWADHESKAVGNPPKGVRGAYKGSLCSLDAEMLMTGRLNAVLPTINILQGNQHDGLDCISAQRPLQHKCLSAGAVRSLELHAERM